MSTKILKLIGFKEYDTEVMLESNCRQWSFKDCEHPGSDVEYLRIILDYAGLDYELIQEEVTTSGDIIDTIANGTADISLIALRMSQDRLKQVSYTFPIKYLQFGYTVKEIHTIESDQFLIKTFQAEVYMLLTCMIALVAAFAFLAYRNQKYEAWLWFHFASFFNQAGHPKSKKTSFLFLTGSYWFTAFLIICFYQARMKYFLTIPLQKGIAFSNLEELLDQLEFGKWKAYQYPGGYQPIQYCRQEQCRRINELVQKGKIITQKTVYDDFIVSEPYTVTFDAFPTDYAPNQVNVFDRNTGLLFIRDNTISVEFVAFAINKNLTLELELINRAIAQFQSSYENVRGRYTPPLPEYLVEGAENGAVTLTLYHMNILFFAYIGMIGCALIIFGVEFLHYRYNWRSDGTWKPQGKSYDLDQKVTLSTDSTLKDVQFTRKTIKFYIEEKIAELQGVSEGNKKVL